MIVSTACQSAGEALRAIDQKDVIKSDFVLVSGDVVSNMNLVGAMQEHRACRERNKSAIMTMARPSICDLHVTEGNGNQERQRLASTSCRASRHAAVLLGDLAVS